MEKVIFDSHAHYEDEAFDIDRDDLLLRLPDLGVKYIMNVGCEIKNYDKVINISKTYDYIYASLGVHPQSSCDAEKYDNYLDIIENNLKNKKVKAIGEIGLDYHYLTYPKETQLKIFEEQLALSKDLDMPVIIHDRDAHEDTIKLLKKYKPKGIVHCYSGSADMSKEIIKLGLYMGFTGVLTFKNARKALEAVREIPLERLLIETDCPYMAPVPYRGKRCDSSMLFKTADIMAQLKNISLFDICNITCKNALEVYNINL